MGDFLKGAVKLRKIMNNKTVVCCRTCGLSHKTVIKAQDCCKKKPAVRFNKNRFNFEKIYSALTGKTT